MKEGTRNFEFLQEYLTWKQESSDELEDLSSEDVVGDGFVLYFEFLVSGSTKVLRSNHSFKTIFTEYLVIYDWALVGNIGGTLGMLVGFSFFGLYEWIEEACLKLFARPNSKRRIPQRNHRP